MSYIIGVSSGWWTIAKSGELLGLASKIGSTATYGVNFVQVDFESIAEFQEPDVIKNIVRLVDTLQVDWGMHGEIGEGMALESALEILWKQSHRRLHQYLDTIYFKFFVEEREYIEKKCKESGKKLRDYLPKYIAFHASNSYTISMIVERYRYAGHITVDLNGNSNWNDFFEKEDDPELKEAKRRTRKWVFKSNLLYFIIARESASVFESLKDVEYRIVEGFIREKINEELRELIESGRLSREEIEKKRVEIENKIRSQLNEEKIEELAWKFFQEITSMRFSKGAITYEEIAYLIIARYLYEARYSSKEPLWRYFFGNKSWDDLEKEVGIRFFDEERGEVRLPDDLVAMVAIRYIIGHFSNPNREEFVMETKKSLSRTSCGINNECEKFLKLTPFSKLHKLGIKIVFENPEITKHGEEGLHRLSRAADIFRLVFYGDRISRDICRREGVEENKEPIFGIVFDQEHYLHNNMDPLKEIENLGQVAKSLGVDDVGKYLAVFHVGAPKPYHPAHEPIDIGSEAQYWIYKYAFHLRKLGFGKGSNKGIMVFERGGARGGQVPAQFIGQSAAALRIIVEYLEKDIEPEKLPMEFYGISSKEIMSEERQLAVIKQHFFDPLRGLLRVPEEAYTFLGRKVIEKGKRPEEWEREELR